MQELSGPGGGQRQRRPSVIPAARRAGAWLVWWVLLMSLWIIVDDSIALDELLAGTAAAALAAFLAELVTHRAATRFRMRAGWVAPVLGLLGQIVRDMVIVFTALWRRLVRGEQPPSGFREIPARSDDACAEGVSRRVLLVGGRSVAPNTIAAGIDTERDVMVVHQLVVTEGEAAR